METPKVLEANVRTDLLPDLMGRVEKKINKPARKLGLEEAVVTLGDIFLRHYLTGVENGSRWYSAIKDDEVVDRVAFVEGRDDRAVVSFEFTKVVLIAAEPKLAGWTFVGTIEHTEAGNILRTVPDQEESLPERFRNAAW